jgi:hypothetical protein
LANDYLVCEIAALEDAARDKVIDVVVIDQQTGFIMM